MFFIILFIYYTGFNESTSKTEWPSVKEMLQDQHVDRIIIITNKNKAEIFIKQDTLMNNDAYEDVRPSGMSSTGPQYYLNISSAESFEEKLEESQKGLQTPVYPESCGGLDLHHANDGSWCWGCRRPDIQYR